MKLLIFAHRGEAQAFFNEWELSPVDFYFTGLFKGKHYYLLITGEGPKDASEKTVAVLSSFKNEINEIINIGIAGSLSPKLKVGEIVWVRTSYAQNAEKCEFKSYTTKQHTSIDCITAMSRIANKNERQQLSLFADIVDRELWSIASAGHLFKIEVHALKLISDDIDSTDICSLVKEQAPLLSKSLFNEFIRSEKSKEPMDIKIVTSPTLLDYLLTHPKLYFTISQTRKLTTVLRGLNLKKTLTDKEIKAIVAHLIEEKAADKTSKELSKILLQEFSEKLNPLNTRIKNKISECVKPLTDAGALVHFDPELEQEYVQINYQIRNSKDQKRLMLSLEQFSYQKIKDIFAGIIDDDV